MPIERSRIHWPSLSHSERRKFILIWVLIVMEIVNLAGLVWIGVTEVPKQKCPTCGANRETIPCIQK